MLNYTVVRKSFDPNSLPIKLETIKAFLKITEKDKDEFLKKIALIATQYAESFLNTAILKSIFLVSFTSITVKFLNLPFEPVLNIKNVFMYQKNSIKKTELEANKDYFFNQDASSLLFLQKIPRGNRLEALYEAGLSNPDQISLQIKDGILKHIYLIYNGTDSSEKIDFVNSLYSSFRDLKISF